MKPLTKFPGKAMVTICFFLIPVVMFSQEIIRFKDGREKKVLKVNTDNDTVAFYEVYITGALHEVRLSDIDTIYPASGPKPEESPAVIQHKYMTGKQVEAAGWWIFAGGAVICAGGAIAGIVGLSRNGLENNGQPAVRTMIAGATCGVAGIVVATAGGIKKAKYKKKIENVTFELQSTGYTTGIAVKMKF